MFFLAWELFHGRMYLIGEFRLLNNSIIKRKMTDLIDSQPKIRQCSSTTSQANKKTESLAKTFSHTSQDIDSTKR